MHWGIFGGSKTERLKEIYERAGLRVLAKYFLCEERCGFPESRFDPLFVWIWFILP